MNGQYFRCGYCLTHGVAHQQAGGLVLLERRNPANLTTYGQTLAVEIPEV